MATRRTDAYYTYRDAKDAEALSDWADAKEYDVPPSQRGAGPAVLGFGADIMRIMGPLYQDRARSEEVAMRDSALRRQEAMANVDERIKKRLADQEFVLQRLREDRAVKSQEWQQFKEGMLLTAQMAREELQQKTAVLDLRNKMMESDRAFKAQEAVQVLDGTLRQVTKTFEEDFYGGLALYDSMDRKTYAQLPDAVKTEVENARRVAGSKIVVDPESDGRGFTLLELKARYAGASDEDKMKYLMLMSEASQSVSSDPEVQRALFGSDAGQVAAHLAYLKSAGITSNSLRNFYKDKGVIERDPGLQGPANKTQRDVEIEKLKDTHFSNLRGTGMFDPATPNSSGMFRSNMSGYPSAQLIPKLENVIKDVNESPERKAGAKELIHKLNGVSADLVALSSSQFTHSNDEFKKLAETIAQDPGEIVDMADVVRSVIDDDGKTRASKTMPVINAAERFVGWSPTTIGQYVGPQVVSALKSSLKNASGIKEQRDALDRMVSDPNASIQTRDAARFLLTVADKASGIRSPITAPPKPEDAKLIQKLGKAYLSKMSLKTTITPDVAETGTLASDVDLIKMGQDVTNVNVIGHSASEFKNKFFSGAARLAGSMTGTGAGLVTGVASSTVTTPVGGAIVGLGTAATVGTVVTGALISGLANAPKVTQHDAAEKSIRNLLRLATMAAQDPETASQSKYLFRRAYALYEAVNKGPLSDDQITRYDLYAADGETGTRSSYPQIFKDLIAPRLSESPDDVAMKEFFSKPVEVGRYQNPAASFVTPPAAAPAPAGRRVPVGKAQHIVIEQGVGSKKYLDPADNTINTADELKKKYPYK